MRNNQIIFRYYLQKKKTFYFIKILSSCSLNYQIYIQQNTKTTRILGDHLEFKTCYII